MADTSMTIRTDSVVKKQAQQVFSELGLDMTIAVNLFLRQVIRQNGIPFELKLDTPNAQTIAAIEEVKRRKADPSIGKTYTDVDEMMKELVDE